MDNSLVTNLESIYAEGNLLNLATFCESTRALGPGNRAVIWVQGCPFRCLDCIAPEWQVVTPERLVKPEDLAGNILKLHDLRGVTISGGEPMWQAKGLARFVRYLRLRRELDIISFSGYRIETLRNNPPNTGVPELLENLDVLIDGPYIRKYDDGVGLRGSSNQCIHHLTHRLDDYEFDTAPRRVEIHVLDGQALLVGVPTQGVVNAFNRTMDRLLGVRRMVCHERA